MRRRTTRRGIAAATGLVLVGGVGVLAHRVTAPAKPVTVNQALARFRSSDPGAQSRETRQASRRANDLATQPGISATVGRTGSTARDTSAAATTAPVPAEGVYVYDTRGYESTDALTGSRHDYPAQTTLTVRHTDCGSTSTWNPLDKRWDESRFCTEPGGVAMRRFTTHHEFFGKTDTQAFDCVSGSLVYRFPPTAGSSWMFRCASGDGAVSSRVTAIGFERILVGGTSVRAMHLHYQNTLTGRNRGQQTQDRWLAVLTGALVKMTDDGAFVTDSPFGTVNYEEHYMLALTSMTAQR